MIELWPEIVKYTKATSSDKILQSHISKSAAFSVIKQCVEDPLILCQIIFFSKVANLFQRLVLPLQSEMPMLPFLYDFLVDLMTNLMEMVVKTDILESLSAVRLCSFDINDNTILKKKAETKIGT